MAWRFQSAISVFLGQQVYGRWTSYPPSDSLTCKHEHDRTVWIYRYESEIVAFTNLSNLDDYYKMSLRYFSHPELTEGVSG